MSFINYSQYEDTITSELIHPLNQLLTNTKQSLEFNIQERLAALSFIIHERSYDDLARPKKLNRIFLSLKESFAGFVDLGLIDSKGNQLTYVGPYPLAGKNYKNQEWFQAVSLRGIHVSDIFMGYRKFPHFVIAIKHEKPSGESYFLRATMNTDIFRKEIDSMELRPYSDAFLINHEGFLQTSSRFFGEILTKAPLRMINFARRVDVQKQVDEKGQMSLFGYAKIEKSPFVVVVIKNSQEFMGNWFKTKDKLVWFLIISVISILIVILGSTTFLVHRLKAADSNQADLLHDLQYTNKMASIGRLAAGVAHEINPPLDMISEKAYLLADLVEYKEGYSYKEETRKIVTSILQSIERCDNITKRLLGFAKRMEVNTDKIILEELLHEVIGYFDSEMKYHHNTISLETLGKIPAIISDRGYLQQVFVNIITNALHAVKDDGYIEIALSKKDSKFVEVAIKDNGEGISPENVQKIFEPFFTTKKDDGTGLGLSITYGIVKKLGGYIKVNSTLSQGTTFFVGLPLSSETVGRVDDKLKNSSNR